MLKAASNCRSYCTRKDNKIFKNKHFLAKKKLNFKTLVLCRGNHDRIECGTYQYDNKTVIVTDFTMIHVEDIKIRIRISFLITVSASLLLWKVPAPLMEYLTTI